MKKLLFILLIILFIPVVKARLFNYDIGDYMLNGDNISLHYLTGVNPVGSVLYYDGEELVCSDNEFEYEIHEGYTINCDKGELWELISYDSNIYKFKKIEVKEGTNVYRINDSHGTYQRVLKKGDIVLYDSDREIFIDYPFEEYTYGAGLVSNYSYLNSAFIVVGYEPTDWTKEIEGSIETYLIMDYSFSVSGSNFVTFVPYKEPEFSISCDKKELLKGEETDCYIEMDTNARPENIDFHLTSKVLSIKEYTDVSDSYNIDVDVNYYQFMLAEDYPKNPFEPNFEDYINAIFLRESVKEQLLKIRVVANEDITTTEVLSAVDINYDFLFLNGTGEVNYEFGNDKVNEPGSVKNPNTASNIIIAIVIFAITIIVLVYLRKKKMTYDV